MWAGVCVIIAELMWVSRYCTQIPRKEDLRIMAYRTHNCNQLTFDQLNQTVSLAGWVDTIRDHGGVIFVDLRDEYGVTQVVFHDDALLKGASWHQPDHYFLLKDFDSYQETRLRANREYQNPELFYRKCYLNMANAGKFSSDRTIRQYYEEIWSNR